MARMSSEDCELSHNTYAIPGEKVQIMWFTSLMSLELDLLLGGSIAAASRKRGGEHELGFSEGRWVKAIDCGVVLHAVCMDLQTFHHPCCGSDEVDTPVGVRTILLKRTQSCYVFKERKLYKTTLVLVRVWVVSFAMSILRNWRLQDISPLLCFHPRPVL